jgi:hypothetical protein
MQELAKQGSNFKALFDLQHGYNGTDDLQSAARVDACVGLALVRTAE